MAGFMYYKVSVSLFYVILLCFSLDRCFFLDKISVFLILITFLIHISCVLIVSSSRLQFCLFMLNLRLILAFFAKSWIGFFFFFEMSLVPAFLMLVIWGSQPERINAAFYLVCYTVVGSIPLLFSILLIFYHCECQSFWICSFEDFGIIPLIQLFFLIPFLIKIPIFGFHRWLIKAHVEAPVVGSMVLAAVVLKVGAYGLYRISYVIEWDKFFILFLWQIFTLIAVSFICFRRNDIKVIIGYSSVVHMSPVVISFFYLRSVVNWGMLAMLLAHGFCSAALFMFANIFYNRVGSRKIYLVFSCFKSIVLMLAIWLIFCVSNSSLPPSLNYFSEIVILIPLVSNFKILYLLPLLLFFFLKGIYKIFLYFNLSHGHYNNRLRFSWFCIRDLIVGLRFILFLIFIIFLM